MRLYNTAFALLWAFALLGCQYIGAAAHAGRVPSSYALGSAVAFCIYTFIFISHLSRCENKRLSPNER